MTRSEHNGQDDELDAFMAGQDALSRQLAALSQPESPKGVDDAIMASIAAQLALEAARPAGGQPGLAAPAAHISGITQRPAANMARWRVPAALAASCIGALLLTLEWQRNDYPAPNAAATAEQAAPALATSSGPAASPTQASSPAQAVAPKQAASPAPVMSAAPAAPAEAVIAGQAGIAAASSRAPRAPASASSTLPASKHDEPAGLADLAALDVQSTPVLPAPPAPAPPPPPPAPLAVETTALAAAPAAAQPPSSTVVIDLAEIAPPAEPGLLSFAARSAPPLLRAPAPASAAAAALAPTTITVTGAARKAAPVTPPDARAADWLHTIDEMLKAGLRKDALDEWRKFRQAYPNYPIPEQLARQIAAID